VLNRDQILAAAAQTKAVEIVHTTIGDIGIRVMSGTEREAYERQIFVDGKVSHEHLRAKLLAKVICDPEGTRVFNDGDIAAISELPAPVVIQLFEKAQKVNALTREDLDELTKK
jgi:hypothetical protein